MTHALRERLARAQFDAEGHMSQGVSDRWEDLPSSNRSIRLGWAAKVINALDLHDSDLKDPS